MTRPRLPGGKVASQNRRVATERHILFRTAAVLGLSMAEAAQRIGCSYNHLILVLDGVRKPSARLDAEITKLLRAAKPRLLAALSTL